MKPLRLSDLPSIDEVQQKFRQKEENLKRLGYQNAVELVKARNNFALSFLYENFERMEWRDKELTHRTLRNAVQWGAGIVVVPTIINIGLARLTGNRIYGLHPWVRRTLRISFYACPLFFWTNYFFGAYAQISLYLVDKYVERIEMYNKVKDPKILNPYLEEELRYIKATPV